VGGKKKRVGRIWHRWASSIKPRQTERRGHRKKGGLGDLHPEKGAGECAKRQTQKGDQYQEENPGEVTQQKNKNQTVGPKQRRANVESAAWGPPDIEKGTVRAEGRRDAGGTVKKAACPYLGLSKKNKGKRGEGQRRGEGERP